MKKKVYRNNIVNILRGLSDYDYQRRVWLNLDNPEMLVDSFVEAANMLFDDCVVGDYLKEGEILFDRAATRALQELHDATDAVDEFRPEEVIIADPKMQIVREKAAQALALIEASDGSESTVEIIE